MVKTPSDHNSKLSKSLNVVKQVLKDAKIEYEALKNAEGFRVTLKYNEETDLIGFAHVFDEARLFMFRILFPRRAPKAKLRDLMELTTRANNGMWGGNFEYDLDTREIKYKTYVDYRNTVLEAIYVKNAILGAMVMIESYAPAIDAVIDGEKTIKAALAEVEE